MAHGEKAASVLIESRLVPWTAPFTRELTCDGCTQLMLAEKPSPRSQSPTLDQGFRCLTVRRDIPRVQVDIFILPQ